MAAWPIPARGDLRAILHAFDAPSIDRNPLAIAHCVTATPGDAGAVPADRQRAGAGTTITVHLARDGCAARRCWAGFCAIALKCPRHRVVLACGAFANIAGEETQTGPSARPAPPPTTHSARRSGPPAQPPKAERETPATGGVNMDILDMLYTDPRFLEVVRMLRERKTKQP